MCGRREGKERMSGPDSSTTSEPFKTSPGSTAVSGKDRKRHSQAPSCGMATIRKDTGTSATGEVGSETLQSQRRPVGTVLVVQWLRLHLPMQGAVEVRSLVRELRSHMPCGQKTKK